MEPESTINNPKPESVGSGSESSLVKTLRESKFLLFVLFLLLLIFLMVSVLFLRLKKEPAEGERIARSSNLVLEADSQSVSSGDSIKVNIFINSGTTSLGENKMTSVEAVLVYDSDYFEISELDNHMANPDIYVNPLFGENSNIYPLEFSDVKVGSSMKKIVIRQREGNLPYQGFYIENDELAKTTIYHNICNMGVHPDNISSSHKPVNFEKVLENTIRLRALQIYKNRCSFNLPGTDIEDWKLATQQIMRERTFMVTEKAVEQM